MEEESPSNDRSAKRLKRSHEARRGSQSDLGVKNQPLRSLSRTITPPASYRRHEPAKRASSPKTEHKRQSEPVEIETKLNVIPSPVQLTHILDISEQSGHNVDTIRLRDILGDPLIKECWQFNFLFDVDFLMNQFDPDVRNLIKVKVVHGSWKKDAPNRIRVEVRIPSKHPTLGSLCPVPKCGANHCIHARGLWDTSFEDDDLDTA
ncbi:hypothetical protein PRK78_005226 [Emydomyces testavorans]|uniref:Uncharacterized protein n=1 Tax=Emydomyces testavorans TaxID=2070801 RepID=A0AAF0DJ89_9EURO|nr:hypothetical protein PRK78_005226 [Emydomyces testavorans]